MNENCNGSTSTPAVTRTPCPTFAATEDIDIHIQMLSEVLPEFDALIASGFKQHELARMHGGGRVYTFPKLFGVSGPLPEIAPRRNQDLFISGGFNYPYHPEKITIIRQLMKSDIQQIDYNNGFLADEAYLHRMGEAKTCFTFCRYGGAMPSRGLEALAMGCGVATEAGSALTLYYGEEDGVYTYDFDAGTLIPTLQHIIENWTRIAPQAAEGAEKVRREFALPRCTSDLLRFLTILAARPSSQRATRGIYQNQRRHVKSKGWGFSPQVNLFQANHHLNRAAEEQEKPVTTFINAARECALLMAREREPLTEGCKEPEISDELKRNVEKLIINVNQQGKSILAEGMQKFPRSLVLKFNALRSVFHAGEAEEVEAAIQFAEELLAKPADHWEVSAADDVMPFDYFESFFNYREYFELITEKKADESRLISLILASINHYVGCYQNSLPHLEAACELDSDNAFYQYSLALHLGKSPEPEQVNRAIKILETQTEDSILFETAGIKLFELCRIHGLSSSRLEAWKREYGRLRRCYTESEGCNVMDPGRDLVLPPDVRQLALFELGDSNPTNRVTDETNSVDALLHMTVFKPQGAKRVLLIPFECGDWKNARGWSYNGFYALRDALRFQGVEVKTLPAIAGIPSNHRASILHRDHRQRICKDANFDQVWIWITHNDYDSELLEDLCALAPVRVGVVMESLENSPDEENEISQLKTRRQKVLSQLKYCTHALTFDERDAETIPDDLPIRALWCPPVVGWRDVRDPEPLPENLPAAFHGTLYNTERGKYFSNPLLASLITQPPMPEESTCLPEKFDSLQLNVCKLLKHSDATASDWFDEYLNELTTLRSLLNQLWQEGLRQSGIQINLPSIFKSYAGRVVESMAAGRPVVSWRPPRERTRALFTPGKEILLFDREKPEELAEQIRWLQANPAEAAAIAERARAKVLAYHTAEVRVRQVLDWIAHGKEPDFGENTDLSTEPQTHGTDMNTNDPNQTDSFESILNQAEACHEREDTAGAIAALEKALEIGDRHPVLLRALGTQLYLAKRFAEAREMFTEFTAVCADDATGHVQQGLAAFHTGDVEACETALHRALALEPDHPEALKLSADLDVRAERYAEARAKYDAIAAQGGITAEALHALAFCQFKTGDAVRAQDTYQQLLTFNADDELASHNLEVIVKYLEMPSADTPATPEPPAQPAKETLDQAEFFAEAGNPEAALAELERAVDLEPNNPRLVEALGSALYQHERFEEARLLFRRLIELSPRDALAYTRLAMTSHATDRFDEFESALGLAMEIDPELPEMLQFMAKVNLEQERYYDAGRIYGKLVELEPENVQNLLALAMCLYRGNQEEAAIATYERALQLDPHNEIARTNLEALNAGDAVAPEGADETAPENKLSALLEKAQAALERNEAQHAIALLENVLSQHPNEVALLTALGNLYFHEGQLKEALEYFRRNANLQPKDIDTQLQAATTALLVGEIEPFEAFMHRALEIDPDNAHGLKLLATANFKAGKYVEAAQLYGKAMLGLPEDLEIILALGVSFHKLNDSETAAACFQRALEVDPNNAVAAENLKAITGSQPEAQQPPAAPATNGEVSAEQIREIRQNTREADTDLPPVALVGSLDNAAQLLAEGKHLESARAAAAAIQQRPFHPEALLHLADVALDAGDEAQAKGYLEALKTLTPQWETAVNALDTLAQRPSLIRTNTDWPTLPAPARSRLSVCLIVKDEEQSLPQALESVAEIAHQVIVVDTGSTDRTVEIATAAGAEVHHFEWCDDFAAARNFALEHARGDWVLVLDADEIFPAESIAALQNDLARENCLGYRLPLVNIIQTETGQTETADGLCHVPRLFRNAPGLHFVGRVHEQVYSSVLLRQADWAMDSGIGTATLHHFGYDPKVKLERDKVKRNLHLLKLAEAEQAKPEPAFLMCYALDLFNDGQFEAAREKDREAFELLSQHDAAEVMPEVRERLVSVFCYHLLQAELYDELVEVAASPLAQNCGPTTSIHYVHGLALMKLDRHEEAIEPLRQCIAKRDTPALTARFKGVEGPGPHHLLADCLAKTDQAAAAKAEFATALELDPTATGVRWSYARQLTEAGEPEKAVELLFEAIENGSIDCRLWSLGCNIVNGHLNDADVALHWTDCAMNECTNHPEISKQRGIALLTVGQFAEALKCFEQVPRHPLNEGALILCQIATDTPARLGDPDKELLISQAFVEWYRRLLERGQEAQARTLAAKVDAIEAVLPTAGQILREAVSVVDD